MRNNRINNLRVVLGAALAVGLAMTASGAFAASGAAPGAAVSASGHAGGGHANAGRAGSHAIARARGSRNAGWGLWGNGAVIYGAPPSPGVEGVPSVAALSEHVTYTYDVPWDAVHRYPPALRTYEQAQGCHTQQQTVPRPDGGKQSVNIIRCY